MNATTETIATGQDGFTWDDGDKRTHHRVTAAGTVQSGTACWDNAAKVWVMPTTWSDWDKDKIIRASRSPNGASDSQWFCRLAAEVRAVIRTHYGLVATGSFPCAAAKDGCGRKVGRKGEYCSQCKHDAD